MPRLIYRIPFYCVAALVLLLAGIVTLPTHIYRMLK